MKNEKADKKDKKKKGKKKAAEQAISAARQTAAPTGLPADSAEDAMEKALLRIGGKWKLRILWALRDGEEQRYSELKRQVAGITDVMLSQSLKELAESGLVQRRQYGDLPPRVAYRITETGGGLIPALRLIAAWGETIA